MLFEAAWQWLRERRVLLPGITTLTRLVASIRERATQRLWETLAGLLDSDQEARLDPILEVADGVRASTLECLRKGPRRIWGQQMRFARAGLRNRETRLRRFRHICCSTAPGY